MIPEGNKKISIIGLGVSGLAVAEKLSRLGERIFVSEAKPRKDIKKNILARFDSLKVDAEFGKHSAKTINDTKLIVVSPGVDLNSGLLRMAKNKAIPIVAEIELAFSFLSKPVIAVTGTNGKTTTVALTACILNTGRLRTVAAGNIGYPLIKVDDRNNDFTVAELSSYQLEGISKFRPWISMILNITEDHLLRHKDMKNYSLSKARIFENQKSSDHLIYNYDDHLVKNLSAKALCNRIPFSIKQRLKHGVYLEGDKVVAKIFKDKRFICRTSQINIKGLHNIQNSLAAVAAAMICGVPKDKIKKALMSFKGVEHRIEYVRKINGISFYNDSKGTNPDSTIVAINALSPKNNIVLILGGRDKGTDLRPLSRSIRKNVKKVVLIGEAADRFKKSLESIRYKSISYADSMDSAVKISFELASKGDAVLLSPACASFDMFSNYEERGKVFKKIVDRLARANK